MINNTAVAAAGAGTSTTTNENVQVLGLSASSAAGLEKHNATLLELEAKKIATTLDVPTLANEVRAKLRDIQQPVRIFGENLANVRDRLRIVLARQQVGLLGVAITDGGSANLTSSDAIAKTKKSEEDQIQETKYTVGSNELILARQQITKYSLQRAQCRLNIERTLRCAAIKRKSCSIDERKSDSNIQELEAIDTSDATLYTYLRSSSSASTSTVRLCASQYVDTRYISCIRTCSVAANGTTQPLTVTGSWTGAIQLWDTSTSQLTSLLTSSDTTNTATTTSNNHQCHDDRIMGLDMIAANSNDSTAAFICTVSIDLTAKIWKVLHNNSNTSTSDNTAILQDDDAVTDQQWEIANDDDSCVTLRGHAARLCRTVFHPMGRHVATTSFDHTWRLWDMETGQNILLQDGHNAECYGIDIHPDGSLCSTTDYSGVVQVWDIRTGKSICHFLGHSKRVHNTAFHPVHGFQLATAGDDCTIKIWDLRKRKLYTSIPAHASTITSLRFAPSSAKQSSYGGGEYLASSSYDGSIKVWNSRNWNLLTELRGHEKQVTGVDINTTTAGKPSFVSCGFDKTLKLWK